MQLAFLARDHIPFERLDTSDSTSIEDLLEDVIKRLSNVNLSTHFRSFSNELGAESLKDVYKSHLKPTRGGANVNIDSAQANPAGTFVSAFVNAEFDNNGLMVDAEERSSWVYKNKDHGMLRKLGLLKPELNSIPGMLSTSASLGLSLLWDMDIFPDSKRT